MSSPQKKPWHKDVKEIVDRVWTDRDKIVRGPDETEKKRETIEDRVYQYYAATVPMKQPGITEDEYQKQLEELHDVAKFHHFDYDPSQKGEFRRYGFAGKKLVKNHVSNLPLDDPRRRPKLIRVYINVKPKYAQRVCIELFQLCGVKESEGKLFQGRYAEVIDMFKVAEGSEAFSSRCEKIVLYMFGGVAKVVSLAHDVRKKLLPQPSPELWYEANNECFYPEVPLMTREIIPGFSFGWEPSGRQWKVGVSFGDVRCSIIARALVEVMTGSKYEKLGKDYEDDGKYWDRDGEPPLDWKVTYIRSQEVIFRLRAPLEESKLLHRDFVPEIAEFYQAVELSFFAHQIDIHLPYRIRPRPPRPPRPPIYEHFVIQ